jgi:DNA-binding MarR family transcriptional regulator
VDRVAEFRTQLRRFLLRTEAVTSGSNLTPQRYDLLLMIKAADRNGHGVRLTDLCDRLQMKQTAVTELVKRTEQAGLVDRHRSPHDGRVSLLRLTAEGERRLVGVFEALREDRESLAESFAELAALFRLADR